jgi:4-amino-4-deoxy-L-arabinose transferase-like glycosyltransferase
MRDNRKSGGETATLQISLAVRVAWMVLILATLCLCYFYNLSAIGLVGSDEPRYAWIARNMAETGDWVTPRLYGQPWFEKPVLYYWGAALSFKLFGASEVTARLPSAFSALLGTLAMAWLALRVYGASTARWLLLLLPTTVGMIGFSHAAATDMPFAAMLAFAMVCAAVILGLAKNQHTPILPRTPWLALLLFGFFLGLAVLAKGPAAIILGGGAVFFWALFTKRWRDAFRCLHPIAVASFCVTALPWYILCARRNPDFFRVFIIEHNFKRYLTPEFQHIQPFWFYIPILLIAFVPWTPLLVWSGFRGLIGWQQTRQLSPFSIFLLCWAAFCVLFFSTSQSKLPGYILPALPPIALLVASSYVREASRTSKMFGWLQSGVGAAAIVVAVVLWTVPFSSSRITGNVASGAGWVLVLLGIANLLLGIAPKKQFSRFAVSWMCVVPVLLIVLAFRPLAADFLPRDPSGRVLAAELEKFQPTADALHLGVFVAKMSRGQQFSLSFYLHREILDWESARPADSFVLLPSSSASCDPPITPPLSCSRNPTELGSTGWFVYRVRLRRTDASTAKE